MFAVGAAAVTSTSMVTEVPAIMLQQVEGREVAARQRSRHVAGESRNRVSRRRVVEVVSREQHEGTLREGAGR